MNKEREFLKKLRYASLLENDLRKELEELLAQPEQEPIAWIMHNKETGYRVQAAYRPSALKKGWEAIPLYAGSPKREQEQHGTQYLLDQVSMLRAENAMLKEKWLAQPEQTERITFKDDADKIAHLENSVELLAGLLDAKKREPLSDETLAKLWRESYSGTAQMVHNFARAIEQQHGIGEQK